MKKLIWAERRKLRRSKIIQIAIFAIVMTAVIVYAQGQFTFYDTRYIDQAGWYMTALQSLGTFYVMPAVIALFGSYMICREEQDDVLKSLRLIPVSEEKLTIAKMMISLLFSVCAYMCLFLTALAVEVALHVEILTAGALGSYLRMYLVNGVGIFLAVSPVISLVALSRKGYWLALVFAEIYGFMGALLSSSDWLRVAYPVLAVFQVSGYYEDGADAVRMMGSLGVLAACGVLAMGILKVHRYKEGRGINR